MLLGIAIRIPWVTNDFAVRLSYTSKKGVSGKKFSDELKRTQKSRKRN